MSIKHLTYLSIEDNLRVVAGNRRLTQLRHTLGDRSLPLEHRRLVEEEVQRINAWVVGTAPLTGVPPTVDHTVSVAESMTVTESEV